jgi:hypothetical protein
MKYPRSYQHHAHTLSFTGSEKDKNKERISKKLKMDRINTTDEYFHWLCVFFQANELHFHRPLCV